MRNRLPLLGFGALLCLAAAGCWRQEAQNGPVWTAVQAGYNAQCAAYEHHDTMGVVYWCAPDYEEIDGLQVTQLPQVRTELASVFLTLGAVHSHATVQAVGLRDDAASVTVDRHSEMTLLAHGSDKAHQIVIDESDTDTWINIPGKGWRKEKSVTVGHETTEDGQPTSD